MKETAAEMFRTIREAFEVLSYGPSKLRYDTEIRLKINKRPEPMIQSTLTSYSNSSFDSGAHGLYFPDYLDAEYIAEIFAEEYMYSNYNFDGERTPMRHARRPKNNYNNVAAEDGNYFNKNLVAGRVKRNIDVFSVKRIWRKLAKQPKDNNYKVTPEDGYCFNKNLVAGRVKRNIDDVSVKRVWRKPAKQPKGNNYKVTPEDGYCFNKNLVAGRVKRNIDDVSVKRHWRKPAKH